MGWPVCSAKVTCGGWICCLWLWSLYGLTCRFACFIVIFFWHQLVHFCQEECGHVSAFWAVTFCRTTCSVSIFRLGTGASRLQTTGMEPWENSMALVAKLVWRWKPFACTCQHFRHACRTDAMELRLAMFCGNAMRGKHCGKGIGIAIRDVDVWKLFLFWRAGLQNHFWFTNKVALCSHVKITVIWEFETVSCWRLCKAEYHFWNCMLR